MVRRRGRLGGGEDQDELVHGLGASPKATRHGGRDGARSLSQVGEKLFRCLGGFGEEHA